MISDKIKSAKELLREYPFTGEPLDRYKDFIAKMQKIYEDNYGFLDRALLPEADKELLLKLFEYHINNVGNPDGSCQYGLSTRGFELKLLNLYFDFLNIKPYGEKYGKKGTEMYSNTQNPDPNYSFGYFTLGIKEAAIWAFKAAKTKFKTLDRKPPVLVPYNKLPLSVFDAAYLLGVEKAHPSKVKEAIGGEDRTAILAISITSDTLDQEMAEIREAIAQARKDCGANCFVHVMATSILDVLRLSDGYNILVKESPKFYAFPSQPEPSKFKNSGDFFVDTLSISNVPEKSSSFQSGLLITTTKNQKFFNSATVAYIGAEDSTVVGSSNGDFLLIDYYFNQRFPVSTLHMLKGKDREGLRKYMSEQKLSDTERKVYENLVIYLDEIKRNSIGYPVNQEWNDEQLNGLFELLIKEKLIYNTEVTDSYANLDLAQSIDSKTGKPYVEKFEEEILAFYKEKVFFPHNHTDFEGYVTTGGTEGNYTGLYLASQLFGKDAVLFLTSETHYSVSKGASVFDIAYQLVNVIDEESGNMNCADLEYKIKRHQAINPNVKIIVNANIATTLKGSIDSLKGIKEALDNSKVAQDSRWIHCDGALQGNVFPFLPEDEAKKIVPFILDPKNPEYVPIDSIAVSGHKFIGAPFPCGITLYRKSGYKHYQHTIREEIIRALQSASNLYADSEVESYLHQNSIISGSKNYYMMVVIWKRVMQLGRKGFEQLVNHCENVALYAMQELRKNIPDTGVTPFRNPMCNTITLTPPPSDYVLNKYNLPTDKSSHIDIMPHVTKEIIDNMIKDMKEYPIDINPKNT